MNILKRIINNDLAIDFKNSNKEDVYELSNMFENEYPGISNNKGFYYPTLAAFYEACKNDNVCFFNRNYRSWDGYLTYDGAIKNKHTQFMTAKSIIDEYYDSQTINIDEKDIMNIVS